MSRVEGFKAKAERVFSYLDRRALTVSIMSGLALGATSGSTVQARSSAETVVSDCPSIPFFSPDREVCYALGNATFAKHQEYKFGNNHFESLRHLWGVVFRTLHFAGPRDRAENLVASWHPENPSFSGNDVDGNVHLAPLPNGRAIFTNHAADRSVLRVRQQWHVSDNKGNPLYDEKSNIRYITLCRGKLPNEFYDVGIFKFPTLPFHVVHSWFDVKEVGEIKPPSSVNTIPGINFNCILFDKKHGIQP